MSDINARRAFWLGFLPGALSCAVQSAYVAFSPFGSIVLCMAAGTCDGGYVWIGFRFATALYLLLNFPASLLLGVLPGSADPLWYHLTCLAAILLSACWWLLLVSLGSRLGLWRSMKRTIALFVVLYPCVTAGAIYLSRLMAYYAAAIHG